MIRAFSDFPLMPSLPANENGLPPAGTLALIGFFCVIDIVALVSWARFLFFMFWG